MRRIVVGIVLLLVSSLLAGCTTILDQKTKAGLQVMTGDISASLFLDGQYLEKTPYIGKNIKPGVYTLKIEPDDPNLTPHEVSITLRKGLLTVVVWHPGARPELGGGVIYEMEKLPDKDQTELSVVSIPDGAIISIQGREKEFAPLSITNVEPGQREFEVSLPSYDTQRNTINLIEGYRTTITVKLAKNEVTTISGSDNSPVSLTASNSGTVSSATPAAQRSNPVLNSVSSSISGASARQVPVAGAKVTIQSTGYQENNQEVLRVRDSASTNGSVLGVALVGSEYSYLDETFNGWYKIQFGSQIGWVSSQYAKLSP